MKILLLILLSACGNSNGVRGIYPYTGITSVRIANSVPDSNNGVFHINYKRIRTISGNERELIARGLFNGRFAELIVRFNRTVQNYPLSITWNRGGSQGSPEYTAICQSNCINSIANPATLQFIFRNQRLENVSPSNEAIIRGEIYIFANEID